MILYKDAYDKIKHVIAAREQQFCACTIEGDYGKGKSFLIQQAISELNHPECMQVKQYPGMNTPYEALHTAITQQLENGNYDVGELSLEISHREHLKQMTINICRQSSGMVVVFEDLKDYDDNLISFLKELLLYLKNHNTLCCIILEFSTDNLSTKQIDDLIELKELSTCDSIKLEMSCYEPYVEFVKSNLSGEIKIPQEQLQNIVKEAFFNPALIKKMFYYFMDKHIIYQSDGKWLSDDIDFKLTAKLFEIHIVQRYENLDAELKNTLHKASITGYQIDTKLLSHPLGIIKSEENLRRIERLSRLLTHSDQVFLFENASVYNAINDKISPSEQKSLHLLIAGHLHEKSIHLIGKHGEDIQILRMLYTISQHYENSDQIEKALCSLRAYIYFAYKQRNYDAAILAANEFVVLSKERFPIAENQLQLFMVDVFIALGKFNDALEVLDTINIKYLPPGYICWKDYKQAFCLFNIGKCTESKIIADELMARFDQKILRDELLKAKLSIFMAGMYHHFGDVRTSSRRYEQANILTRENKSLKVEHYRLLSISNMFLDDEHAIKSIESSMNYFSSVGFLESYAKSSNNVAINYIYLYDLQQAEKHLQNSIEVFENEYSPSVHYPQNNLATVYALQEDYCHAIDLFKKALHNTIEPFSFIWITINIAHCHRLQGDLMLCKQLLDDAEKRIHQMPENTWLLQRNLKAADALLALANHDASKAFDDCQSALEIELLKLNNNSYPIYFSKLLIELSELSGKPIPEIANPYLTSYTNKYLNNLLEHHAHWGNFLFWEA